LDFNTRPRLSPLTATQVVCEEGTGVELPELEVSVRVRVFHHSQGTTQYRLHGFRSTMERFKGWRILSWVKLAEDLLQMRIGENGRPPADEDW
jgi:hypothetical protein